MNAKYQASVGLWKAFSQFLVVCLGVGGSLLVVDVPETYEGFLDAWPALAFAFLAAAGKFINNYRKQHGSRWPWQSAASIVLVCLLLGGCGTLPRPLDDGTNTVPAIDIWETVSAIWDLAELYGPMAFALAQQYYELRQIEAAGEVAEMEQIVLLVGEIGHLVETVSPLLTKKDGFAAVEDLSARAGRLLEIVRGTPK